MTFREYWGAKSLTPELSELSSLGNSPMNHLAELPVALVSHVLHFMPARSFTMVARASRECNRTTQAALAELSEALRAEHGIGDIEEGGGELLVRLAKDKLWGEGSVTQEETREEVMARLILAKARMDWQDPAWGRTALMHASGNGSSRVLKMLIQARASVNKGDDNGETALMKAFDVGITTTLLDAKADASLKDNDGATAQEYADHYGTKEMVQALRAAR